MTDMQADPLDADSGPPEFAPQGQGWMRQVLILTLGLVVLIAAGIGGVRLAVLTDWGRRLVVQSLDGLSVGPVGRLHVEGLSGDLFSDFAFARLQMIDAKGVWLDVSRLEARWSPGELLARRLHVRSLDAARVLVLRQPETTSSAAPKSPGEAPVTVIIDALHANLETRPQFSLRPGSWDVSGGVAVYRHGKSKGALSAKSRLHAGDGLAARFVIGLQDRIALEAVGVEAPGGALAGYLGFPADKPFALRADADGVLSAAKLRLVAKSGADTPLVVDATWGRDGASIQADAKLTTSTRTSLFADRLGPDAHLTLSSHRLDRRRFQVDLVLAGAHGRLRAQGPLDWRSREAKEVDVVGSVDTLQKWWVPIPKIGAAEARGKLSGGVDHFVFKGQLIGNDIEQNGYVAKRAVGPGVFSFAKGVFDLNAKLKVEGGGGSGLLWTLLGAAPTVNFEGERRAEGRYVFKSLDVRGSHLSLKGRGGQALFGGFDFNGDGVIDGVGLGRKGKGVLTGGWRASAAKGQSVWTLTAQAKGHDLTTGDAATDRLLGLAPVFSARGRWTLSGLELDEARLDGAASAVTLHGLLSREGALKMALDWTAQGPFDVGPIEMSGSARGTGEVSGDVETPRADLKADLHSVDFGQLKVTPAKLDLTFLKVGESVQGLVSVSGASPYGVASAKSAFRFLTDGIELSDIETDAGGVKLTGAARLQGGGLTAADLLLTLGPGAFLSEGRLSGQLRLNALLGVKQGLLDVSGQDFVMVGVLGHVHKLRIVGRGPLADLPVSVKAEGATPFAWRIDGDGRFQESAGVSLTLDHAVGRIRKADFALLRPASLSWSSHAQGLQAKVSIAGGVAEVDAAQQGDKLDLQAHLAGVALQGLTDDYIGTVSGDLKLSGLGPELGGSFGANLSGARSRDAPVDQQLNAELRGGLHSGVLQLVASAETAAGLKSHLDLALPAEASAYPFRIAVDRTKPLRGQFDVSGEIRSLWDLLAGGDRSLSGIVSASGALSGSLNHLRATGSAGLAHGQLHDAATGLNLKDLTALAEFDETAISLKKLSGSDGHLGSVTGEGVLSLKPSGESTLKLDLSKFQLFDNEVGRAQASGAVTVRRDPDGHAQLTGALAVDRADIAAKPPTPSGVAPLRVREIHVPVKEGADAPTPRPSPLQVAFDVSIRASRGIFVRGNGVDVELSLDSHVRGDSLKPDFTGVASIVRGSYDFSGKRFDFNELGTVRLGSTPETTRLNLTAERDDPSLKAVIRITGTAARPEIALTSSPVYPQDEILARVLFGVSASQLSGFEAAQLASALASLATGGGFDIMGGLRQFARLDRLSVGVDQSTVNLPGVKQVTTISGGKYLTDNVYVELTGGGRLGPTAQVELRVRRNLSVISQVGTQGDASLSVRFRQDYK